MAAITSAANTAATEMELITRIVQAELLENTVVMGTVTDYSGQLEPGVKSIEIPRFEADRDVASGRFGDPSAQNPDGVTPVGFKTASLTTDKIDLNKWVNLPYRIPDRVAIQSRVPLEAELARKAGKEMAIYIDKELIEELRLLTAEVTYVTASTMALVDITEARKQLNVENVPMSERYLLISPEQEKNMLNIDNFIKANEYGAREALLNGEIGRVFGFTVLVSNLLEDGEAFAYHKECVGMAMQKSVDFETQRADVNIRATDYSYAAGWGSTLMYDGKKGVKFADESGE
jgi:N4-gp56 family major capsid protein